jgi:hypothetical protein
MATKKRKNQAVRLNSALNAMESLADKGSEYARLSLLVACSGKNMGSEFGRTRANKACEDAAEDLGEILGVLADYLEERKHTEAADYLRAFRDEGLSPPEDIDEDMPTLREIFTGEYLETFDHQDKAPHALR